MPPTHVGDNVVVGTDRGLYVIDNGEIDQYIDTRPVKDVSNVGDDRVVVLTDDDQFANVLLVDLWNGEIIWSESHERTVYSNDFGFVDRQVPAFDAAPIGDRTGDGTDDVAVAAGKSIIALGGEDGEQLWQHDRSHNVWELAYDGDRLYAGTQGGTLLGLDPDGTELYDEQVAGTFTHDQMGEIPHSVWSVEPTTVDGAERLALSTEDGQVVLADRSDGTAIWSEQVLELDDDSLETYYRGDERAGYPTLPGDANFENVELIVAEDALIAVVQIEAQPDNRNYRPETTALHRLDVGSGDIVWSDTEIDFEGVGNVAYSEAAGGLLVPEPPDEDGQQVDVLGLDDGSVTTTFAVDTVPGADPRGGPSSGTGYVGAAGDDIAITAASGDLIAIDGDAERQWGVPSIRSIDPVVADFTGDGIDDYLLVSQNQRQGGVQSRSLVLRSGTDGSVVWSEILDTGEFLEQGGHEFVRVVDDGSGGADLITVRQPDYTDGDPSELPPGELLRLDGSDGTERLSIDLVNQDGHQLQAVSMDVLGDVTGNGNVNVLLGDRQFVYVVDTETGETVFERTYQARGPDAPEEFQPVDGNDIRYRAVGGDEPSHVLAISRSDANLAVLEPEWTGDELEFDTVRQGSIEGDRSGQTDLRILGDLTGDGYDELLVDIRDDDTEATIIAPGDLSVPATFQRSDRLSVSVSDDVLIAFEDEGGEGRLSVYEGVDERWSQQLQPSSVVRDLESVTVPTPATVTGEGVDSVAVVETPRHGGQGVRVNLHDATGTVTETIDLEPWVEGTTAESETGITAQSIPDQTGDGTPELGIVASTDGTASSVRFYIVDPTEGEVLLSGDGTVAEFVTLDEEVGLLRGDGSLRTVNPDDGVTLSTSETDEGQRIEWTFDADREYVSTLTVDGVPVAITTETATDLRLPDGTHEVEIRATSADGITIHDSTTVTVEEGSSSHLFLYAGTGVSIGVLFGIGLVPTVLRKVRG
nr:PQQ-binding-like beta-propeller repeat protein [Natranaeroarchaeum aerophilus]